MQRVLGGEMKEFFPTNFVSKNFAVKKEKKKRKEKNGKCAVVLRLPVNWVPVTGDFTVI